MSMYATEKSYKTAHHKGAPTSQPGGKGPRPDNILFVCVICALRGFAKLKKFQKSKNNLEVGGWVQVPFG